MPEQPDESDIFRETVPPPPAPAAPPVDPTGLVARQKQSEAQVPISSNKDPGLNVFNLNFSIGSMKPLPAGVLSDEVIERLRSGDPISADDLEKLRSVTSADERIVGKLMEGMLAAGFANSQDADGADPTLPADPTGDPNVVIVPGSVQKFEWNWKGNDLARDTESEPATYYEALTGQPDPMRGFFVTSRRLLNVVTWLIAVGVPLGLVTLGIVTGESPDTIFFMGFAGLVVGMLFKHSFPKTPFG
jgi:hypothetical protein